MLSNSVDDQEKLIKKLKAMVLTLQRQIHHDTIKYKRLVFDHNGLKQAISILKQRN